MKSIQLKKIASWLYHNEPTNEARTEIYTATDSTHPLDDITYCFSDENEKEIQRVNAILDKEENKIIKAKKLTAKKKKK